MAVGSLAVIGLLLQSPQRLLPNLLLIAYWLLSLGLGGLAFIAMHYVSGGRWATAIRRVPEAMAATIPFAAVGLALVLVFGRSLYPWAAETAGIENSLQKAWLHWPFFLGRTVVYLGLWALFGALILRHSRRQDVDGDIAHTVSNVRLSAAFLVVFGLTLWLASEDWLMSLEPGWSSTVFSVYQFSGIVVAGLAGTILFSIWLHALGLFRRVLTTDHLHDLGMLLFGFSTFWVYLWFCQYMLIWYVNNPEETPWVAARSHGPVGPVAHRKPGIELGDSVCDFVTAVDQEASGYSWIRRSHGLGGPLARSISCHSSSLRLSVSDRHGL
jgi:hypothetical protein